MKTGVSVEVGSDGRRRWRYVTWVLTVVSGVLSVRCRRYVTWIEAVCCL
jgi:hypothetical protein